MPPRKTTPKMKTIRKIMLSATSFKFSALNDSFCDWAKLTGANQVNVVFSGSKSTNKFMTKILENGEIFEEQVIGALKIKFGAESIIQIGDGNYREYYKKIYHTKTINALKQGYPLITQAILHNNENGTYGAADILIRSDYLNQIVVNPIISEDDIIVPAKKLGKKAKWHYRVIDIKHSTIPFASNKKNMTNPGKTVADKIQVYVYSQALANAQGYNPHKGYILGKGWKHNKTIKGEQFTTSGNYCFEYLAEIDYAGYDKKISENFATILKQRHNIAEDLDNHTIDLSTGHVSHHYLYPNMKNEYDIGFRDLKKKYADSLGEITSLYRCGIKERQKAFAAGIHSWRDPKCNAEVLGITNTIWKTSLNHIIKINRDTNSAKFWFDKKELFAKNKCISSPSKLEFFVDYEIYNKSAISDPRDTFPITVKGQYIFMIGVGYTINGEGWQFKTFSTKTPSVETEKELLNQFTNYYHEIQQLHDNSSGSSAPVFHWNHTERTEYFKKKHLIEGSLIKNWVDLCSISINTPFVVKGALNFKLKSIAKALYANGLITTNWDESCTNGLDAMILYTMEHNDSAVEKYNEVDCKVMQEILQLWRNSKSK